MSRPSFSAGPSRAERGVILFIALIVLVAMSLAGVALMRSVDTNVLIAGNLAFRQGATLAADRGVEDARTWLINPANETLLEQNQPGGRLWYWAQWHTGLNVLTDYDWSDAGPSQKLPADASGNDVRYVIHRMCNKPGKQTAAGTECIRVPSVGADVSGTKGAAQYGQQALTGAQSTYYRVSLKIQGPRNTVSYVQTMLN